MKASSLPTVTGEQMREIDEIVVDDLHIGLVQMMENAGRSLAQVTIDTFKPRTATVLAGSGGNGGGGLVAARHLANRGVEVGVVVASKPSPGSVPDHQLDILRRMAVRVDAEPRDADVVIDAIVGYSLRGDPRGRAAELIVWAAEQAAPVLALDVPSGLDASTGEVASPCMRAAATLTLALPKLGLLKAKSHVGRLFLADISIPSSAFKRLGISVPELFSADTILELE